MVEFKHQWAIILGASSGMGLATAKKLAAHGLNLILVYRNPRSQELEIQSDFDEFRQTGISVTSYNRNALDPAKRQTTIDEILAEIGTGKVRILIHSIAKGNLKPMVSNDKISALSNDDFAITIDAMATSLYDWTKAIFEHDLFSKQATVLSYTSEGSSKAWPNYAAVSAAKAALEAISRSIALEFAPHGINCNCIQPGVTDTASLRMIPGNKLLKEQSILRNPNKRLTRPEDVANVAYLLCKDEARWINGSIIIADGGEHIN